MSHYPDQRREFNSTLSENEKAASPEYRWCPTTISYVRVPEPEILDGSVPYAGATPKPEMKPDGRVPYEGAVPQQQPYATKGKGKIEWNAHNQFDANPFVMKTGGTSSHYDIVIEGNTFIAQDVIEVLNLNYSEANILKAIIRQANARLGNGKVDTPLKYDREKMVWFSNRLLAKEI
jgi:hypothetical protein